jgi:hypothetical protein
MLSTTGREAAISSAQPARLELKPDQRGPTVLDGGWWPRSEDLATELPDLIRALDERHGRTRRIMLEAGNQIHAAGILASITAAAPAPAPGPVPDPAPAELAGSATS